MSISGLRKASWYDPDTETVVQANMLADEGEFYTRPAEGDDQTPDGQNPYAGDESFCELMVYDMAIVEQLETWQRMGKRISMVAAGYQENVQWYERSLVQVIRQRPVKAGRRNSALVRMQRTGHGEHDIHSNVNLLAYKGWTDEDADEIADGYGYSTNPNNIDFSSGKQFINEDVDDIRFETLNGQHPPFPIAGVDLTISVQRPSLHGSADEKLSLYTKASDGALVQKHETSVTSTGRKSLTITTSPNDYFLYPRLVHILNLTATGTAQVADPAIRTDGSDQYVAY